MPARSKAQQRLFGMALAVRRKELSRSEVNKEVLDIVDSDMTNKQIEDFAATKHTGLKDHIKESIQIPNKVFIMIKPGFLKHEYDILGLFEENGYSVFRRSTKWLTLSEARELYLPHKDEEFYDDLCQYMSSGLSTGILLTKKDQDTEDMIEEVNKLKDDIRKTFGIDEMRNCIHSSDSVDNVFRESSIYGLQELLPINKSLYESLMDDDDTVFQRADDRTLAYQVDKMLKSGKRDNKLIEQLESKVAIYRVDDNIDLRSLISNYVILVGNDCSLNWIDVSNVKDMDYTFYGTKFDGDISKWDVSNVENMNCMFYNSKFNGDISKWNVSNVRTMKNMFERSEFNGNISKWNVYNVKSMTCMFDSSKFNSDISKWNVSKVKDMSSMFENSKFNGDISKWDVSKVEYMSSVFCESKFNGDISKWNVSSVKYMNSMFRNSEFNGDISKWDVSNVVDMSYMFIGSKFNGDISKWNVSKVEDMGGMFYNSKFNSDISKWNVSRVENVDNIFTKCPIKKEYKPKFN